MNGCRVLIVEDEMVVQLHLTRIVGELGHEVVGTAMNAREALSVAAREAPELVLMDIHLADGDDGVETARELARGRDCAVVFVTAFADQKTIERTAEVGAAGYLVKPFTAPAVRAAISTALAGHHRLQRARHDARALSSIVDSIGDALFVLDAAGLITFTNPRATDLTGCPPGEAEGRMLLDVLHPPVDAERRQMLEALAQARLDRTGVTLSRISIRKHGGAEHTVDVEIEPFHDAENGEAQAGTGVMVSLRDRSPHAARMAARTGETRQSFGEGTRILVYSHDTFGLGHLRRCLALIRTLCARHPGVSALLVTGSPMVHRYPMPAGADYVKLPALRKVESEQYEARTLNVSRATIRSMRSNLILHTLRDFDPNVLLVDHSPIGSKGELLPALEWLAERGSCTRILGLRDIIDEPEAVVALWKATRVYDILCEHYEHVVVYGNRGVYDPVAEYRFPAEVAAKTRFVNYVCDGSASAPDKDETEAARDGRPVVAVSIGGGDGGADTVILPFLEMMRRFASQIDFRAEILTGPLVAGEDENRLRALAQGLPVDLRTFIPSTAGLFRHADVVVATAGYNTTADLMQHARRAVLIPRVLYRQEQLIRARRLEELGLVTSVHPEQATPEALLEAIRRTRREEPLTRARAEGRVFLDGAERFSEFCGELLVGVRAVT